MEIPKKIKDEIWEYCRLNDITDLNAFMVKSLQQGFNIQKYGATPFKANNEVEIIEKEVIKEIIKEVPVEVIVEVEKIVEVPFEVIVEKEIIKEVPVEVFIEKTLNDDEKHLKNEIIVEKRIEVPIEVIREVEKIVEVPVEVIKEVEKIVEVYVDDGDKIKKLEKQIENLKIELELEKNRNYQPPKKEIIEDKPKKSGLSNVISWVSRNERDEKDLYGE